MTVALIVLLLVMETIGVRELRQNASKYLARVEAGEEPGQLRLL